MQNNVKHKKSKSREIFGIKPKSVFESEDMDNDD